MQARVTQVGELARQFLRGSYTSGLGNSDSGDSTTAGIVIAVFENSIYLEISGTDDLVCVGTNSLLEGPINVSTTLTQLPEITTGHQWHCSKDKLYIEGLGNMQYKSTQTNQTAAHDLPISTAIDPCITRLLHSHLSQRHTHTEFNQKLEDRLQAGIRTLTQWLQSTPGSQPEKKLQNIIGCGDGLTPSGDDILIGTLITLKYTNRLVQFEILSEWIKTHATPRTNRISLAHLHAACKGHAVILLHDLLNAIGSNDTTLIQQALKELDQYGHRSGKDALRGLVAVIDFNTDYS